MEKNLINEKIKTFEAELLEQKTNGSLTLAFVFDFVSYLIENKSYDYLIEVLEKLINDEVFKNRNDNLKLIDKLVSILLKTEDFTKLNSLLDYRLSYLSNESDLIMQKFYKAVCYEGLALYEESIETLLSIKDNISSKNLVNKYLKLSMIYLKVSDYDNAQKYYNHALKFDKLASNPTFLLAKSDLLNAKGDYLNALKAYEEYFIKTKNHYRYIDRFINLNIALNNLADAYSFFSRHRDIMNKVLSKHSRLQFYKAGLRLVKKLNKTEDIAILSEKIEELETSFKPFNNIYEFYNQFIRDNYHKTFIKKRDIILNLFNYLERLELYEKMVYVNLDNDQINIKHYTKGLLLEKTLETKYLTDSVYEELKGFNQRGVYDLTEDHQKLKDPFITTKTKYIFTYKLDEFAFLVFYIKDLDYLFVKKSFELAGLILQKLINDFKLHHETNQKLKNLINMVNEEGFGFVLLKNNIMYLLNDTAKSLLNCESDYLNFNDFQMMLQKNIYLDELIKTSEIDLKLLSNDLSINVKVLQDEMNIYLLMKENKTLTGTKAKTIENLNGLPISNDLTLALINLRNYHEYLKGYNYQKYLDFLSEIKTAIKNVSASYFYDFYFEGMDNIYLLLETKDKRTINRILEAIILKYNQDIDIRAAFLYVKTEINEDNLYDLKYLVALTSDEYKILQDNKGFRTNKEIFRTISLNVKKILSDKNIKLAYKPVVNWENNEANFLYVDVLNRILLGNIQSLKKVLWANNLESEWDELLINQLNKDIRIANFNSKFFVEVSLASLSDRNMFNKLGKKLNNKGLKNSEIIYVVDFFDYMKNRDSISISKSNLAFKNVVKELKFSQINIINDASYAFIDSEVVNFEYFDLVLHTLKSYDLRVIYDHGKTNLTKSFLKDNSIQLVMGEAYGKYESLKKINN
jgi:hypothetical protein